MKIMSVIKKGRVKKAKSYSLWIGSVMPRKGFKDVDPNPKYFSVSKEYDTKSQFLAEAAIRLDSEEYDLRTIRFHERINVGEGCKGGINELYLERG
jgi:hypothetical protein